MSKWLGSRGEPQSNKKLKSIWMVWNLKKKIKCHVWVRFRLPPVFFFNGKRWIFRWLTGSWRVADLQLQNYIYIVRARRYCLFFYPLILILLLCHKWTFLSLSIIFQWKKCISQIKKEKQSFFFSRRIPLTPFYPLGKYFYF